MQGAQRGQSEDHGSVQGQGDFRRKQEVNVEREISRLRDDLAQCKDKISRLETSAQEIRIASMQEKLDMANEGWLESQRFMDRIMSLHETVITKLVRAEAAQAETQLGSTCLSNHEYIEHTPGVSSRHEIQESVDRSSFYCSYRNKI